MALETKKASLSPGKSLHMWLSSQQILYGGMRVGLNVALQAGLGCGSWRVPYSAAVEVLMGCDRGVLASEHLGHIVTKLHSSQPDSWHTFGSFSQQNLKPLE